MPIEAKALVPSIYELLTSPWPTGIATASEIAAGGVPVNYAIPSHLSCGFVIVERYGNNTTPGVTDMTAATQTAVNVALQAKCAVISISMCLLTASVNIDRHVDGAAFDNYFFIGAANGGGFQVNTAIAMFSSTLAFSTDPVSQLLYFNGVTFIGNSGASYVLNDGRFLRTCFDQCNFDKILGCNSSIYVQSIHFINCNLRRGVGTFWTSVGQSYDFKFINCICEAWTGNLLNLAQPIGCAIIGNLLEGCTGTAIIYNGASGLTVTGNYFEANLLDIDGTGATQANGVALIGNQFSHTAGNSNPATYSVVWGNNTPSNCVSIGNFHNAKMHNFPVAGMDVLVKDSAVTSLFNNQPFPLWNSGNQNFFSAANTTLNLTDGVLGNTYGGAFRGYGIGGRGGQAGVGTLNAGTYTEGLTCDENAAIRIDKRFYPPDPTQTAQTSCSVFASTGAPSNANGSNGDIYFNAAGGALTTIYQKRAGAWVGIV